MLAQFGLEQLRRTLALEHGNSESFKYFAIAMGECGYTPDVGQHTDA